MRQITPCKVRPSIIILVFGTGKSSKEHTRWDPGSQCTLFSYHFSYRHNIGDAARIFFFLYKVKSTLNHLSTSTQTWSSSSWRILLGGCLYGSWSEGNPSLCTTILGSNPGICFSFSSRQKNPFSVSIVQYTFLFPHKWVPCWGMWALDFLQCPD